MTDLRANSLTEPSRHMSHHNTFHAFVSHSPTTPAPRVADVRAYATYATRRMALCRTYGSACTESATVLIPTTPPRRGDGRKRATPHLRQMALAMPPPGVRYASSASTPHQLYHSATVLAPSSTVDAPDAGGINVTVNVNVKDVCTLLCSRRHPCIRSQPAAAAPPLGAPFEPAA